MRPPPDVSLPPRTDRARLAWSERMLRVSAISSSISIPVVVALLWQGGIHPATAAQFALIEAIFTWPPLLWMGAVFYVVLRCALERESRDPLPLPLRGRWLGYFFCGILALLAIGAPVGATMALRALGD